MKSKLTLKTLINKYMPGAMNFSPQRVVYIVNSFQMELSFSTAVLRRKISEASGM